MFFYGNLNDGTVSVIISEADIVIAEAMVEFSALAIPSETRTSFLAVAGILKAVVDTGGSFTVIRSLDGNRGSDIIKDDPAMNARISALAHRILAEFSGARPQGTA